MPQSISWLGPACAELGRPINKKLVGGFNPSEKYGSIGMINPNIWKNNTCSKPPGQSTGKCPLIPHIEWEKHGKTMVSDFHLTQSIDSWGLCELRGILRAVFQKNWSTPQMAASFVNLHLSKYDQYRMIHMGVSGCVWIHGRPPNLMVFHTSYEDIIASLGGICYGIFEPRSHFWREDSYSGPRARIFFMIHQTMVKIL